jgi:hypothetical protein
MQIIKDCLPLKMLVCHLLENVHIYVKINDDYGWMQYILCTILYCDPDPERMKVPGW